MIRPKHVAIIMDGNGRWGLKKKKSRNYGHKKGIEILLTRKKEQRKSTRTGAMTYITLPPSKPILLK